MMGGSLTATDVELRGAQTAIASFDPKSSVVVKRSIVTYEGANQKADLLMALRGGEIRVEESLVRTRASSVLFLGKDLPGIPAKDVDRAGRISFVRSNVRQVDFNREVCCLEAHARGARFEKDAASKATPAWPIREVCCLATHASVGIAPTLAERICNTPSMAAAFKKSAASKPRQRGRVEKCAASHPLGGAP